MRKLYLILLAALAVATIEAQPTITLDALPASFNRPVDITGAGDGTDELYLVEQPGTIQRFDLADESTELILDITDRVNDGDNETGLLGLAFHPAFPDSNYFYVNYTATQPDGTGYRTRVSRFTMTEGRRADPNSELIVFAYDQARANHNAGDLAFGPDGYLYIPTGDSGGGGDPDGLAQNTLSFAGKLLRIDIDNPDSGRNYGLPADNPFLGSSTIFDEIWSYGLRNPYRISFDRLTGDLWIGDVGQGAREEINRQLAGNAGGQNYGWNCREGEIDYNGGNQSRCGGDNASFDRPVLDYSHNFNGGRASVTGGFVYRGSAVALQGIYVFGDFVSGRIYTYDPAGNAEQNINTQPDLARIGVATFGEDNEGELYVADLGGTIYRIGAEGTTSLDGTDLPSATVPEVYPNPTDRQLTLDWNGAPPATDLRLRLYASDGRLVFSGREQRVELPELPKGLYLLRVENGGVVSAHRVMVR